MNVHDSERISGIMKGEGYRLAERPDDADLLILNTCSIRQKAEQKFYSEIGRLKPLKKKNNSIKIAVAGCIAQSEGEKIIKKFPYIDFLFGPQNIMEFSAVLNSDSKKIFTHENNDFAKVDLPAERDNGIRAWVNIMYGCNNYCSYCVVPYTRGRERSRPVDNIISEVNDIAKSGYKEVTLLGQNVNSYKGDCSFPQLLRIINEIDGIERIRFITSHPKDFNEELINVICDLDKVCKHIHLPLQSGSTRILKLMNRKYAYSDYIDKVFKIRKLIQNVSISSDIIAGFPTETDNDHKGTIKALKEIGFDGIFAFKFSKRPNTKAATMKGQIDEKIKAERLNELLEVQDDITLNINRNYEGKNDNVLVEGISENNA